MILDDIWCVHSQNHSAPFVKLHAAVKKLVYVRVLYYFMILGVSTLLFYDFWWRQIFLVACGLSPVVAVLELLCMVVSCCGWSTGLVAPRHVGSSRTRDQTHGPCIGRRILKHWTTREVPVQVKRWKH